MGLNVDVHHIGAGGLRDVDSAFHDAYGLSETGAVLVRPDGFVGWRATSLPEGGAPACPRMLRDALQMMICRTDV
jgi:putative polyketide hydroxylase